MKRLLLISFVLAAFCFQGCKCEKDYTGKIPKEFDAYCQKTLDEWQLPGMAVVVVKDGKTVFLKGYGVSNLETQEPVDPCKTQYVIASTSKAFTGALLATVIDEVEDLDWNDPVIKHLPDFKLYDEWATKNIMVKEVMTHHYGVMTYAMDDLPMFGYDRDDLYHMFGVIQPTYSFRSKYAYNNESYTIAAKIIEKYTGMSWDDAIAERIFKPLGMKNSTTGGKSFWTAENLATPYNVRVAKGTLDSLVAHQRTDTLEAFTWNSAVAPAAFVMTTAEDMGCWLKMHLNHGVISEGDTLISRKNHDMLFYPQTITSMSDDRLCTYGQGWTIEASDRCSRYIRHTGLAYGYTAIVGLVPELNMGIAILTNNGTTSDAQAAIVRQLIDMYKNQVDKDWSSEYFAEFLEDSKSDDDEEEEEKPEIVPALKNGAYVGTYTKEVFGDAKVYEKDGELWFSIKKVDSKLEHKTGNMFEFYVPGAGHFDLTFDVAGGRAKSLTFDINDPIGDFKRIK
jgi:Beta-lactamase class C and other penicillin binding proteins